MAAEGKTYTLQFLVAQAGVPEDELVQEFQKQRRRRA